MSQTIPAFPLQWPIGWKRTAARTVAAFGKMRTEYGSAGGSWRRHDKLSIGDGISRVRAELSRMGMRDYDVVISTNLPLRLDGLPRADSANPADPGVAVYWRRGNTTRCMAIDRYTRVADNLAAIAATLEAMRAIERHGGAEILDRAFTGFVALEAPREPAWYEILEIPADSKRADVEAAYRRAAMKAHPDRPGGSQEAFLRVTRARDQALTMVDP